MKSKKFFDPINYHIITSTTIYNDHRFTTIYTHHSLFRAESYPNTYCIEYSKYMGILSPGLMTIPLNRNMNHCHRRDIYIHTYIYIHTWVLMKYNGNIHIYILWHVSTVVAHIPIKSPHLTGFLPPLNPHGPDSTLPQRP